MNLSELKCGQMATVKKINNQGFSRSKILTMGLRCGINVSVERISKDGETYQISFDGFSVVMEKKELDQIEVK